MKTMPKYLDIYLGHPMSSDIRLISLKLLLKSELYYPLHVAIGVAYSRLKYIFFFSQPDLMLYKFVNNTVNTSSSKFEFKGGFSTER